MTLSLKGEGKQIYYLAGKKKKELRRISLTTMEGREQHLPSPYKR
jgi:hypothetical protein